MIWKKFRPFIPLWVYQPAVPGSPSSSLTFSTPKESFFTLNMGSIAVQYIPSAERVEPGSFPLVSAKLPTVIETRAVDAEEIASEWVDLFNKTIRSRDLTAIAELFLQESYWRDQLCLSWDIHTLHGPQKIVELVKSSDNGCRIMSVALDKTSPIRSPKVAQLGSEAKVPNVQAFLNVEIDVGKGQGLVRLVNDNGKWKAFILFTFLKELTGYEEAVGRSRPIGAEHGGHSSKLNWLDQRKTEEKFEDGEEPTVLIVGKRDVEFQVHSLTSIRCRTGRTFCSSPTEDARHQIVDR
jgi:hypothetical protein